MVSQSKDIVKFEGFKSASQDQAQPVSKFVLLVFTTIPMFTAHLQNCRPSPSSVDCVVV